MTYDHIFDSSKSVYEVCYPFSDNSNQPLTVLFEKENVSLAADKNGNAVLLSTDGVTLSTAKAESDRRFSEVYCLVKERTITLRFPIKETIDHYPNCDGEYDRYSERIVDNVIITFSV